MSYAKFMDPVYAAYLIHSGCPIRHVEPASTSSAKQYCFDKDSLAYPLEEVFYGIDAVPAKIAYIDFIGKMNQLLLIEDTVLRKSSNRCVFTGRDARAKRVSFATTDQSIAACLLEKGLPCWDVRQMGKDRGFKFYFDGPAYAEQVFVRLMTSRATATWLSLKYAWKRATCIRINRTNHRGNHSDCKTEYQLERTTG